MPNFTLNTLLQIVTDTAPKSASLQRVGLVGSYAREEITSKSDVDLIFDTGEAIADEAILSAGMPIRKIISDQFGLDTDIISYSTINRRINNKNSHYLEIQGYKKMLEDLKWIWSRN